MTFAIDLTKYVEARPHDCANRPVAMRKHLGRVGQYLNCALHMCDDHVIVNPGIGVLVSIIEDLSTNQKPTPTSQCDLQGLGPHCRPDDVVHRALELAAIDGFTEARHPGLSLGCAEFRQLAILLRQHELWSRWGGVAEMQARTARAPLPVCHSEPERVVAALWIRGAVAWVFIRSVNRCRHRKQGKVAVRPAPPLHARKVEFEYACIAPIVGSGLHHAADHENARLAEPFRRVVREPAWPVASCCNSFDAQAECVELQNLGLAGAAQVVISKRPN